MNTKPQLDTHYYSRTLARILTQYWLIIITCVLFFASYWQIFTYYWSVWDMKDSYYSHGPLVPILALIMAWANKERLQAAIERGSWLGIPLLIIAIPIYIIGMSFGWRPICAVAMFFILYGLIAAFAGKKVLNILFLPVLFLWVMIPIYQLGLDVATGRFQIISSTVATKALQLFGADVTQQGNIINSYSLPCPLVVGGVCSGLKLLIALIMCTCFLAYMLKGPIWKKMILIASSLPFSIIVNSIRIIMIAIVGFVTESVDSVHSFHDYSGYIALVLSAVLLMGFARLMGMKQFRDFEVEKQLLTTKPTLSKTLGLSSSGVTAVILLTIIYGSGLFLNGLYDLPKGHINRNSIPTTFASWTSQSLPIEKDTKAMLNKGDLLSLVYGDASGVNQPVMVFMDAATDRSAFHDPHLCLPGSGNKIVGEKILTLKLSKPEARIIQATSLHLEDIDGSKMIVMYWYVLDGVAYPRHLQDLQPAILNSRISDIKELMLHPTKVAQTRREIASRQIVWYRFSTGVSDWNSGEIFLKKFIKDFMCGSKL